MPLLALFYIFHSRIVSLRMGGVKYARRVFFAAGAGGRTQQKRRQ